MRRGKEYDRMKIEWHLTFQKENQYKNSNKSTNKQTKVVILLIIPNLL